MNAQHLAAISRDLPDVPTDVAEQWLAPYAARPEFGWPPPDDGRTEPWARLLAGRSLAWWRDRDWHQEALPMTFEYMSHATQFQVSRLKEADEAGHGRLPDSRRRIAAIRAHIAQHGTWPRAPVAYPDADGLAFIDGHHRFAALLIERSLGLVDVHDRHLVWLALPRPALER